MYSANVHAHGESNVTGDEGEATNWKLCALVFR